MAIGKILNIGSGGSGGSKDGSTAMPINDVVVWQKCAGIYGTYKYTTLNEIVNDTVCLKILLNNSSANNYLSRSKILFEELSAKDSVLTIMSNISPIMVKIATNETLSTVIGSLQESSKLIIFKHHNAFYTSGDSFSSSALTYKFSNNDSAKSSITSWENSANVMYNGVFADGTPYIKATGHYWYYTFAQKMILKYIKHNPGAALDWGARSRLMEVQAKTENGDWLTLASGYSSSTKNVTATIDVSSNVNAYTEYRLYINGGTLVSSDTAYATCSELQWHGIKPNVV